MIIETLKKNNLNKITKTDIKKAIYLAINGGIKSRAQYGYSGDDIRLYGNSNRGRESIFEIRNHSGMISILITDYAGNFIVNTKYSPDLGLNVVADLIWDDFKICKPLIDTTINCISLDSLILFKNLNPLYGFKKIVQKQKLMSINDKTKYPI